MNIYRERVPQTENQKFYETLRSVKRLIGTLRVAAESQTTTIQPADHTKLEDSFKIVSGLEKHVQLHKVLPPTWEAAGLPENMNETTIYIATNTTEPLVFAEITASNPTIFCRALANETLIDESELDPPQSVMDLVRSRMPERNNEATYTKPPVSENDQKPKGSLFGKYKR